MSSEDSLLDDSGDRAVGLLDQIAQSALDDDYYLVRSEPRTRVDTVLTGVALAVFALLVTVAAVQTQIDRPATEREQQALADDVALRRAAENDRKATVAELRASVSDLLASSDGDDPATKALAARTAALPVRGPGLVMTLTPAADDGGVGDVSDTDLQVLVNAMWFLGAEAVAVNDQRIGTMTSIRTAGEAITVNYTSLSPPYVVSAIGDGDRMVDLFEASGLGKSWRIRSRTSELRFSLDTRDELRLPQVETRRQQVVAAKPLEEDA